MGPRVNVRSDFKRARDIVLAHGWNSTCFQIVNPGINHWFGSDGESVVGYVVSNGVRVAAGAPICSKKSLASVAKEFEDDAANAAENPSGVCVTRFTPVTAR